MKERLHQLQKDIARAISSFETETGMYVDEKIEIRRCGLGSPGSDIRKKIDYVLVQVSDHQFLAPQ